MRREFREILHHGDDGQVTIFVVLAVSTFILLFVGFGVDMTALYLHRQMAQGAADAACVAAGMDLLVEQTQGPKACVDAAGKAYVCGRPPSGSWGAAFDCTGTTNVAPCQYAASNGYTSPGLTAGTESNLVQVSFPTSIPGVVTPAPAIAGPNPFVTIYITDQVRVYFASLLGGSKIQNVYALAKCGLQQQQAPVPLIILDPTETQTMSTGGTPVVQIVGGSTKSIEVNSSNATAVHIFGSAQVDLSKGGPNFTGSTLGVFGGPGSAPCTSPCKNWNDGTTGSWQSPAAPIPDPFKSVPPPSDPGAAKQLLPNQCTTGGVPCTVHGPGGLQKDGKTACPANGCDGCPDPNGCQEYFPGDYTGGFTIQNQSAIFQPGIYYIKGGAFNLHANSLARPTDAIQAPGDGSLGTVFYLTCANPGSCTSGNEATIAIGANSGKGSAACPAPAGTIQCYSTSQAHCPGDGGSFPPQLGIPAQVTGNVLLGPCVGDGTYDGAPHGATLGADRGILFWQDRSASVSTTLNGGGGLLLVGTMYFHDCGVAGGAGTNCVQPPTGYQTVLSMTGGSGTGTRLLGEIVTDQLGMQGNSTITMDLNPFPIINILKVALLQ